MDDISTRNMALSRKELYILIDAMERQVEIERDNDFALELEESSQIYNNTSELLKRLQNLLGE